jgi:hypothetical protein
MLVSCINDFQSLQYLHIVLEVASFREENNLLVQLLMLLPFYQLDFTNWEIKICTSTNRSEDITKEHLLFLNKAYQEVIKDKMAKVIQKMKNSEWKRSWLLQLLTIELCTRRVRILGKHEGIEIGYGRILCDDILDETLWNDL